MTIDCPYCHTALGEVAPSGTTRLTCPRCSFAYRVVAGSVLGSSSRAVAAGTDGERGERHRREHALRLRSGSKVSDHSFSHPGRSERIAFQPGETAAVVYTYRGMDELVAVVNGSRG